MRRARLMSVSFPKGGYRSMDENVKQMVRLLDQAADYRPDFVCFTEVARELGCPQDDPAWQGESVPGETTAAIGEAAARVGTHAIVGMQERLDGETYNAAVLIGRDGDVIGRYHKVQPTVSEMERYGTAPGDTAMTFDTDMGRVGMLICFDLKFPEVAMSLARNGARVAFFPSMFHGGQRHQAIARDYGMYLVVSQAVESVIVDLCGRRLAWQGYQEPLVERGARAVRVCRREPGLQGVSPGLQPGEARRHSVDLRGGGAVRDHAARGDVRDVVADGRRERRADRGSVRTRGSVDVLRSVQESEVGGGRGSKVGGRYFGGWLTSPGLLRSLSPS